MTELEFTHVDEYGFANLGGMSIAHDDPHFYPRRLGPLLEWIHLSEQGMKLPKLARKDSSLPVTQLTHHITRRIDYWSGYSHGEQVGFIRSTQQTDQYEIRLNTLLVRAMTAAQRISGLTKNSSKQLIAAMKELESNIQEHSLAIETGLIAFRADRGVFEFVIYDRGRGILSSLRKCKDYSAISDEGQALTIALRDGESRHGRGIGRGFGFRQMFLGIAEMYGQLRFRSGDYALSIEGLSPVLAKSTLSQKAHSAGFFVSVTCSA